MEAAVADREAVMTEGNDGRLDELSGRIGYLGGRVDEMSKRMDELSGRVDEGFAQVRGDISALHRLLIRVSIGGAVGLGIVLIGAIAT